MIELMRRLDRRRFAVHAVCFDRSGAWLSRVEGHVASIAEFPMHGFLRPASWRQMLAFARWCRHERITILQTCDFYTNVFGMIGGRWAGVPVRIASRRDVNPGRSLAKLVTQRFVYEGAHRVVANSRAAAARLALERLPRGRIRHIANGVDVGAVPAGRSERPIRRFITVANLRPEKAHERLLAAAKRVLSERRDMEFQIVGDGRRRAELQRLASALGVSGQVQFLGHREDVSDLLGEADVFILPSRSEAFPNAVIEAMAAGLPVVACAVGGLLELVEEGRTGRLVPPDDETALAAALLDLASAPDRARAMGRAARAFVEARFSFERMTSSFEELYLSELAARGRAARLLRNEPRGVRRQPGPLT